MLADRQDLDGNTLVRTSRLTARIDNNCIADGFQIYLHSFIVAASGEWAVVQQGMNTASGMARRYHWHSAKVRDFVEEPHSGILGEPAGPIHESGGRAGQTSARGVANDGARSSGPHAGQNPSSGDASPS
jgi:hypothetical protein